MPAGEFTYEAFIGKCEQVNHYQLTTGSYFPNKSLMQNLILSANCNNKLQ